MHQSKSLSEYLVSDCIRHECFTDVLRARLQTETCLVPLDSLDEVVHVDDHRAVVQHLEEFVHCYNRFIITSRHAGYRETLLDDTFAHYSLQELDETHIWHFLESWCSVVETALSSQEKGIIQMPRTKYEVDGLKCIIQTVPGVRRLASKSLYLRILAQLPQTGALLPSQRVALYDQITNILTQI